MKVKIIIIISYLVCALMSACKSKDIIAIPMSDEVYKINCDLSENNLTELIQDYALYPIHKEYTYNVIFGDFDYSLLTYTELLSYRNSVSDEELKEGFNSIIEERQQNIILELSQKTVEEFIAHYKLHEDQHDFLDEYISSSLIANIDNMEYDEVKYLSHIFENTKFHTPFAERRMEIKKGLSSKIKADIAAFEKAESELINEMDAALKMSILSYLRGKYPTIINKIIDVDFPEDHASIRAIANNIIDSDISQIYLLNAAKIETSNYALRINKIREERLESISYENIDNIPFVDTGKLRINDLKIPYNPGPLYAISKIQNKTDALGTALGVISFLGNFTPAALLLDAIDLGYGIYSAKKRSKEQVPYLESFSKSFLDSMNRSGNSFVNQITYQIKKEVKKSQSQFKKMYYECY